MTPDNSRNTGFICTIVSSGSFPPPGSGGVELNIEIWVKPVRSKTVGLCLPSTLRSAPVNCRSLSQ
jgi:hypothetical protein